MKSKEHGNVENANKVQENTLNNEYGDLQIYSVNKKKKQWKIMSPILDWTRVPQLVSQHYQADHDINLLVVGKCYLPHAVRNNATQSQIMGV